MVSSIIIGKNRNFSKQFSIVVLVFLLSSLSVKSQQLTIEGKIRDKADSTLLSFANVRVIGTMLGTSANEEGHYKLYLKPGEYKLAASYLGYNSDTATVSLIEGNAKVNFSLEKSYIKLPAILVTPRVNPAITIIEKAIDEKIRRQERLNSFVADSYTKGVLRTNQDNIKKKDSTKYNLKIEGIFENTGITYYQKPDLNKDIITGRKQTANFPPEVNIITGNRVVQSFYEDKINFYDIPVPGPLEDDALSYYDFYLEDSLLTDNQKVYKLGIQTIHDYDPGFTGSIYILDKTYDLIKVDVILNRAANQGGMLDTVRIIQQFLPYDSIYMPIDYRIFARLSLFNLMKFSLDISTVMYNYTINQKESAVIFDKAFLKVLPGADSKDTTYWDNNRFIPSSIAEKTAYRRIDSIMSAPKSITTNLLLGLFQGEYPLTNDIFIPSPLNMYRFNRIEGHTLGFGVNVKNLLNKRLDSHIRFDYGFSDKKLKYDFASSLLLGEYRTYKISFDAFNNIRPLFNESNNFNDFTSSLFALAFKDDFLDYYYSKGFSFKFNGDILPILKAGIGFTNNTFNSAEKNTDFSFSSGGKKFRENPPIYETRINSIDINFKFDFRDYYEDGYFRRKDANGKSYITCGGGIIISPKKILNSNLSFLTYKADIDGILNSFRTTNLSYKLLLSLSDDAIPFQMLYTLPGSIDGAFSGMSFRTVKLGEYFGSKVLTVNLQYNFNDEFFRILPVPLLRDWNLQISAFLNSGWVDISRKSKDILPVPYQGLTKPLIEAGFGVGYALLPMKLEFAWRLTNKDINAFTVGLNTEVLLK